jgi:hypothetical protein
MHHIPDAQLRISTIGWCFFDQPSQPGVLGRVEHQERLLDRVHQSPPVDVGGRVDRAQRARRRLAEARIAHAENRSPPRISPH